MDWLKEMYEEHCAVLKISNLLAAYSKKLGEGREDQGKLDEILEMSHAFTELCHHGKEEKALFPAIVKHDKKLVAGLMKEHAKGKMLMQAVRDGTRDGKISAIRSYGALIRAHIVKENNFFNDCYEKLGDGECRALSAAFRRINSAVLGKGSGSDILCRVEKLEAAIEKM
jgi:hemerythrin-like domain-containing protein